jgi:hypothetical protein
LRMLKMKLERDFDRQKMDCGISRGGFLFFIEVS